MARHCGRGWVVRSYAVSLVELCRQQSGGHYGWRGFDYRDADLPEILEAEKIWRFDYDEMAPALPQHATEISDQVGGEWPSKNFDGMVQVKTYTAGQILKAWMPFAILSLFVLLWGLPSIKLAMIRPRLRLSSRASERESPHRSSGVGRSPSAQCDLTRRANCVEANSRSCALRFQLAFGDGHGLLLCRDLIGPPARTESF